MLLDTDEAPYLDESAAVVLRDRREEMQQVVDSPLGSVEYNTDEIRWWTFAGGRINATLRHAIDSLGHEWKAVPDNFLVKIRGEHLNPQEFEEALGKLRVRGFWENEKLWSEIAESLPSYRLSKFQPLMPPWVEREVVAGYLLDLDGTWKWLSSSTRTREYVRI